VRRDDAWARWNRPFGTDEFLRYCERVGASRMSASTPASAPSRKPATGSSIAMRPITLTMPDLRRANGRDKPWNVKIWGLGNEIDGPWQLGHRNAEDMQFALEAAKAMRRADDSSS